jgi:hypothetical protein
MSRNSDLNFIPVESHFCTLPIILWMLFLLVDQYDWPEDSGYQFWLLPHHPSVFHVSLDKCKNILDNFWSAKNSTSIWASVGSGRESEIMLCYGFWMHRMHSELATLYSVTECEGRIMNECTHVFYSPIRVRCNLTIIKIIRNSMLKSWAWSSILLSLVSNYH